MTEEEDWPQLGYSSQLSLQNVGALVFAFRCILAGPAASRIIRVIQIAAGKPLPHTIFQRILLKSSAETAGL